MYNRINSNCKLVLYADDSTTMFSHKKSKNFLLKLGKELESCSECMAYRQQPFYAPW